MQEPRGATRAWWSKRWLEAIEPMGIAGRFGRGRAYAASGQVVSVSIAGPRVEAQIVGTRPGAYRATLDFRVPSRGDSAAIAAEIAAEPMLAARLLAGDLPTRVEELFRERGMSLFPMGKLAPGVYDVVTSCSCPDWANPCKHVCALLMLLGEEISRRPLTLLELRGLTVGEIAGDED